MKTRVLFAAEIFFILALLSGCSKKDESPVSDEVVSWIKPIVFRNENILVLNLTKKADDGFLASGYNLYNDKSLNEGFVINYNSNGDSVWCRKVKIDDYPNNGVLYSIQKSDNELIIAGLCSYVSFKRQRFIAWLDGEGHLTKYLLFPMTDNESVNACKIIPLENGNFYYCIDGSDETGSSLTIDLLDSEGTMIRSKIYRGIQTRLESLYLEENENLLIVGSVEREFPDYADFLFILIDASGNEIYRRSFGTTTYDVGYSACADNNGGHFMSGMQTNLSEPVIYPVSSSGIPGSSIVADNPASGSAAIITAAGEGGYNLIIQTTAGLYFKLLADDLSEKQSLFLETPPGSNISYVIREVFPENDGSVSFLFDHYGPVIIKTIPLN